VGQVYSRDVGPGSGKAFAFVPMCLGVSLTTTSVNLTSCYPFDSFNLYRGDVATDLSAGSYGTCLRAGLAGTSTGADLTTPLVGRAFFYLATGRTSSLEGALGFTSSGLPRPNAFPCP
jgi:hypothetical protein